MIKKFILRIENNYKNTIFRLYRISYYPYTITMSFISKNMQLRPKVLTSINQINDLETLEPVCKYLYLSIIYVFNQR